MDRLLGIMAEADHSADLIAAETAVSERQAELESLQSERAYLADQVAMSTLRVDLVARDDPRIETEGFVGGLQTGWSSLVAAASSVLVVTGVLVPWLVVLGVPLAVAIWLRRRARPAAPPVDGRGRGVRGVGAHRDVRTPGLSAATAAVSGA